MAQATVRDKLFYVVALGTAFLLYGATFFWLTDGWLPGVLGLAVLPFIVWAADALGIPELIRDQPPSRPRLPRQYDQLRARVELLLEIIRQMNWLAVDMSSGVRPADEVEAELDRAVLGLKRLVEEIREVAGKTSHDPAGVPESVGQITEG